MTDCRFCRGERPAADHKVAALYTPRKINYELLGNQTPHIHWHVIPRLADDPAPLEAVWAVPHAPRRLDAASLAERVAALRAQLGS